MKEKDAIKKIKIGIFLTSILILLFSVTYAFVNMNITGTKRQVIVSGNLKLVLNEDENNLIVQNAFPMYDEVGMIGDAFTFQVISESTVDASYALRLVDVTVGEKLDTALVKYGIVQDGNSQIDFLSSLQDGVVYRGIIKSNQTIDYSLRLWIDSSVEDESLIKNKSLKYKIELVYGQILEDGEFQYGIESNELTENQIEISPYMSETVELSLTSFNDIDTGYELYYNVTPDHSIEAGYLEETENKSSGIIQKEETKNIKLMFNNLGDENVTVEVKVKANLVQNKLLLEEGEETLNKKVVQKYYVYDYTGDYQTFVAPTDGTYKIELWGGGADFDFGENFCNNKGGYVQGEIPLFFKEQLYIYVGQSSLRCNPYTLCSSSWNGGGEGGNFTLSVYPFRNPSGGGATDIRLVSGSWNDAASLRSRIMVAAGSGVGYDGNSSAGGLIGYTGSDYNNGTGGTQIAGGTSDSEVGSFGYGGKGRIIDPTDAYENVGFGGGSGYYGGGGGLGGPVLRPTKHNGSGGGGSSFISGHPGCIAIQSETNQTPKVTTYSSLEDSYHYSGKVFINTVMIDGKGYSWTSEIGENIGMPTHDLTSTMIGNNGNGYARITYLGV